MASPEPTRPPLAPATKFKKADHHHDSIRSIVTNDGNSDYEGSTDLSRLRAKFLLEHEKESYESDSESRKGKQAVTNNTTSSNADGQGSDESLSSSAAEDAPIVSDAGLASSSSTPASSRPSTPPTPAMPSHKGRSSSISSNDSTEGLLAGTKSLRKKSLLAGIFDKPKPPPETELETVKSKPGKDGMQTVKSKLNKEVKQELQSVKSDKPKLTRMFSQPSNLEKRVYSRKPFQQVESYNSVKDKKYKALLERQEQRVLTEIPRMIEAQLMEEAYPIILKMCQEYIKNLGEKHEITLIAIERLNVMAKDLGRECEYKMED